MKVANLRFLIIAWGLVQVSVVSLVRATDTLNVYTYDAMVGKAGLGEILKSLFEKNTGSKLNLISFQTVGEALNQLSIEGAHSKADILMGVDSSLETRARATDLFAPIQTDLFSKIQSVAKMGEDRLFLPFDYGFLAFIYHRSRVDHEFARDPKITLDKFMTLEKIKKRVVIEDPRTSSLGLSFLRWTQEVCKTPESLEKCWQLFFPKLVTISPGWSGAYGLFLQGEADWVLSYTTSRAYHLEKEKKDDYECLMMDGGHALQVESAAVLKHSKKTQLIKNFLEILVSEDVQKNIPTTQWMYPARKGIDLPNSFKSLPTPQAVKFKQHLSEIERRKLLADWVKWASITK